MACGASVRISVDPSHPQGDMENQATAGPIDFGGPLVAEETLVLNTPHHVSQRLHLIA